MSSLQDERTDWKSVEDGGGGGEGGGFYLLSSSEPMEELKTNA